MITMAVWKWTHGGGRRNIIGSTTFEYVHYHLILRPSHAFRTIWVSSPYNLNTHQKYIKFNAFRHPPSPTQLHARGVVTLQARVWGIFVCACVCVGVRVWVNNGVVQGRTWGWKYDQRGIQFSSKVIQLITSSNSFCRIWRPFLSFKICVGCV